MQSKMLSAKLGCNWTAHVKPLGVLTKKTHFTSTPYRLMRELGKIRYFLGLDLDMEFSIT
jgi:hypothetical protein